MGQDLFGILMQHPVTMHSFIIPLPFNVILRVTESVKFAFLLRRQRDALVFLVAIGSGDGGEMGMNSLKRRHLYAVLLASQNMQGPFSPLTQEDRSRARRKRIFFLQTMPPLDYVHPPSLYLSLQWSTVTTTHAVGPAASC